MVCCLQATRTEAIAAYAELAADMLFLVFASMVLERVDRAEAESWSVEICRRWASGARDQLIVVEVILCALAEFHVGREEVVVFGGKYEQLVYLETDLGG